MNCAKIKKLLVDYAEDSLSRRTGLAVERHLSRCEACRSELSKIKELKQSLLSLDEPERDDEFWQSFNRRLAQKLVSEKEAAVARRPSWLPGFSYSAAAVALIIVVLVFFPRLREWRQTISEVSPEPKDVETVEVSDLEIEQYVYSDDDVRLALADLSSDEIGRVEENLFLLIEESWESTPEDIVLDNGYERSIYGFIEDLSEDLSLEEYEEVYEELTSI